MIARIERSLISLRAEAAQQLSRRSSGCLDRDRVGDGGERRVRHARRDSKARDVYTEMMAGPVCRL